MSMVIVKIPFLGIKSVINQMVNQISHWVSVPFEGNQVFNVL